MFPTPLRLTITLLALCAFAQPAAAGLENLRATAAAGNAEAQYALGARYFHGERAPEDKPEALRWWRMAAEQGHANAQADLAGAYARGDGADKDAAEAARWYQKAAEQGHPWAQWQLGEAYRSGRAWPRTRARRFAGFAPRPNRNSPKRKSQWGSPTMSAPASPPTAARRCAGSQGGRTGQRVRAARHRRGAFQRHRRGARYGRVHAVVPQGRLGRRCGRAIANRLGLRERHRRRRRPPRGAGVVSVAAQTATKTRRRCCAKSTGANIFPNPKSAARARRRSGGLRRLTRPKLQSRAR